MQGSQPKEVNPSWSADRTEKGQTQRVKGHCQQEQIIDKTTKITKLKKGNGWSLPFFRWINNHIESKREPDSIIGVEGENGKEWCWGDWYKT